MWIHHLIQSFRVVISSLSWRACFPTSRRLRRAVTSSSPTIRPILSPNSPPSISSSTSFSTPPTIPPSDSSFSLPLVTNRGSPLLFPLGFFRRVRVHFPPPVLLPLAASPLRVLSIRPPAWSHLFPRTRKTRITESIEDGSDTHPIRRRRFHPSRSVRGGHGETGGVSILSLLLRDVDSDHRYRVTCQNERGSRRLLLRDREHGRSRRVL